MSAAGSQVPPRFPWRRLAMSGPDVARGASRFHGANFAVQHVFEGEVRARCTDWAGVRCHYRPVFSNSEPNLVL
eukprot:2845554-Rhodomonas_salina.1